MRAETPAPVRPEAGVVIIGGGDDRVPVAPPPPARVPLTRPAMDRVTFRSPDLLRFERLLSREHVRRTTAQAPPPAPPVKLVDREDALRLIFRAGLEAAEAAQDMKDLTGRQILTPDELNALDRAQRGR